MKAEPSILFPPFHLEPADERLWRGAQAIALRPKTFAVLRYLLAHPGQLVTKEELLDALWPDTYVSEALVKNSILELRKALGDDPQAPRFIETVHRRGYRFLPAITTQPVSRSKFQVPSSDTQHSGLSTQHSVLVGRETELAQLHCWLEKALNGERQIVFVTGEPGIGKTTVVEAFLLGIRDWGLGIGREEKKDWKREGDVSWPSGPKFRRPIPNSQSPTPSLWIGRGQCIEQYGVGEAYMPVLEALGRLCRELGGERLVAVLAQYAPTWLVQMPALLSTTDLEALQRKVQGATRERMLREMAEALEALTTERPLVLCLEDLHWSDVSTLDLLSVVAQRPEQARLLVLGTYRPVEMLANGHPLHAIKQELHRHKQCEELRLGLLTESNVAEYLAIRFRFIPSFPIGADPSCDRQGAEGDPLAHARGSETVALPQGEKETSPSATPLRSLAQAIHQRTEGNPLFMVNVVDYLSAQGRLQESGWTHPVASLRSLEEVQLEVPESLQQLIEKQIDRLSPEEQRLLEGASVVGAEFSAAAVAAGLQSAVSTVEWGCTGLARREQFIRVDGVSEWPDGTVATRYRFLHALYQAVLYERVPVGRRIEQHRWIGEGGERAYGERAREVAAELAVHFERGREYGKAIQYLHQAGENALRRSAHQEAMSLFSKGLELLQTLPNTPERAQQELTLQIALGNSLMATKGYAAQEVEQAYTRAHELCREVGDTPQLFPALYGLWGFHLVRGEHRIARELAEQFLSLAQRQHDTAPSVQAYYALGTTLFLLGEFLSARAHVEQVRVLYDPQQHRSLVFFYGGIDAHMDSLSYVALSGWYLGYADQALESIHTVLALAQDLSHPFSLAFAVFHAAELHYLRRDGHAAQERAAALIALSHAQGFPETLALGTILRGWALAEQGQAEEGIVQLHEGLAALQAIGTEVQRPYYLAMLAEACGKAERAEEGLRIVTEALAQVDKTGERYYEAELYRLKGTLTLEARGWRLEISSPSPQASSLKPQVSRSVEQEVEGYFLKAIEIARRQQAKSLELRATVSLARLWRQEGKRKKARKMLAEIYNWFTEGFDTKDLQEAGALLEELSN